MTLNWTSRLAIFSATLALVGVTASALPQAAGQAAQGRAGGGGTQTQTGGGRAGAPQTPVRDTPATTAAPGTGVISGMVTSDSNGSPVRRARVTLSAPELRGGRSTISDDKGRFSFTALPAGRFTLTTSKAGYVDITYGAKRPGRPGTPIQLAAGAKMERANIVMPKGGVITGIVVDDTGEAAPQTQVRVMRYVIRNGEKTLQQAGQDQTDDRGMYRVFGLQPGDYLVTAVPRNVNIGDIRQTIAAEMEAVLQQLQGSLGVALAGRGGDAGGGGGGGGGGGRGGGGGFGGRGGGAGPAGIDIQAIMGRGGRGNQDLLARAQELQQQLAQEDQAAQTTYAPVYYPGTATPSTASPVSLAISEERNGVDFRLMLVPTAKVEGTILSQGGALPQGTQITLIPMDQVGAPQVPGAGGNSTRALQDGRFTFQNIPPGQYRVMARGAVRDPAAAGAEAARGGGGRGGQGGQGPGGRGGPGAISQVLWGSADVNVNGQDVKDVQISLQEGMTITGRIAFDSTTNVPPTDLSNARVNLSPRGQQFGDMGGIPPAQVDASGRFTIKGVLPGKYTLSAGLPGGGRGGGGGPIGSITGAAAGGGRAGGAAGTTQSVSWVVKSVTAGGRDALDFGLTIEPNQDIGGATVLFTDKTQEISGTIQDTLGNPTADYTIVVFASDKAYWVPQARRIAAVRPGTDGKFSFRNLPAGDYRLTAVTDVEPGEWFDPAFLEQLVNASIPVLVREGEKKTQDIKVAGGG